MPKQEPLTESYFYILLCLYKENLHGYGIMQKAKELSEGKVAIGAGTMYGATSNMMKKGWIEEILEEAKDDRGKRLYQLTENGKSVLKQEVVRLENLIKNAKSVMENKIRKEKLWETHLENGHAIHFGKHTTKKEI